VFASRDWESCVRPLSDEERELRRRAQSFYSRELGHAREMGMNAEQLRSYLARFDPPVPQYEGPEWIG
jgi:hypothetical protein